MSIPFYWVNAFTTRRYTGNPAVVVPGASDLSERQMQIIAREMNCSETVFILRPTDTEADLRLRWFTPTQEVPLCGHATIAAVHILAELRQYNIKPGLKQILYVETLTGVLAVTIDHGRSTSPWIWLTLPQCQFEELSHEHSQQLQATWSDIAIESMVFDTLNRDVLIQVSSLAELHQLSPDFNALKLLGQQEKWRGYSFFTTETLNANHHAQLRFFAPQSGITEDPATGSASGPLAQYLTQQGLVMDNRLVLEQGHCLQRPGQIHVDLSGPTPRCGGQAVTVVTGVLNT